MGFRFLALTFVLLLGLGAPALAADSDDDKLTGCANDTWNAMTNQALLEARREDVMNKTFIRKPDSVLMYACMEQMIQNTEQKAGPIFSETDHWQGNVVDISGHSMFYQKAATATTAFSLGESSLDAALSAAVRGAYNMNSGDYAQTNFDHNYLGGASNIKANPKSSACDIMKNVWKYARCENFDDPKVFYTFKELTSEDPRKLPPGTECGETGIKQEVIDRAGGKYVLYDEPKGHMDYLLGERGCKLTVATGVTVTRRVVGGKLETFPDKFCTNAGCSYVKDKGCK